MNRIICFFIGHKYRPAWDFRPGRWKNGKCIKPAYRCRCERCDTPTNWMSYKSLNNFIDDNDITWSP